MGPVFPYSSNQTVAANGELALTSGRVYQSVLAFRAEEECVLLKDIPIVIFVCLAVKAFHLELVSSLTSEAFLAALSRFQSRRGKIEKMYSNNSTNFVGAFRKLSGINGQLARNGIEGGFNPPLAPHFEKLG